MARQGRLFLVGYPQHVIARGNNRQVIFCCNEDYRFYLEKLKAGCLKYGVELHSYVLMTNRVHLLMTPLNRDSISRLMQMQGRCYVQYFNYSYRRTGTLFEGRYKSSLVDTECYLLRCMRYIELNPVRADMAAAPCDYPWSSYHCNAMGKPDDAVKPHQEYLSLGLSKEQRLLTYRDLFRAHLGERELAEIRNSADKGWVLGSMRFKEEIGSQLARRLTPLSRGGDRKSVAFVSREGIR